MRNSFLQREKENNFQINSALKGGTELINYIIWVYMQLSFKTVLFKNSNNISMNWCQNNNAFFFKLASHPQLHKAN